MRGAEQLTNVDDLLRRQAQVNPDATALIEDDRRLSWQQLDRHVEGLARGLAELGLVAGHRVALASANRVELVAGYLAVLRGGLVAVPVNPSSTAGQLARMLADCGARVCLVDASTVSAVREAVRTGPLPVRLVLVGEPPDTSAGPDAELAYDDLPAEGTRTVAPRDPEALAVLVYTSGTSGRPRAAMLSHRALLANIEQCAATTPRPVEPGDVVLGLLPMFHVYGLNAVLGQVLLTGASLVLGDRFDADETLRLVRRERVTCLPVAPPVVTAWLDRPGMSAELSSVRLLVSGAAPLAAETAQAFERSTGITVQQGYGLTEASPVVTSTLGTAAVKPGSAGQALPGVELRIVDETGADVAGSGSDPGEVWVRGANLFSGYWPDGDEDPGSSGWLRTGDIGFLDADGDLFLVDRLKELVIVSGFNVYPSEIEEVVSEVDGVAECAVIGTPHAETGETVVAYVVSGSAAARDGATDEAVDGRDEEGLGTRAGGAAEREALQAAVLRHCAHRLARFKVPTRVEVVDELPHTSTGKVAKSRLRAIGSSHEVEGS